MGAAARARAATAPAEKMTAGKRKPQQSGAFRRATWEPGPGTDAVRPLDPHTRLAMESRFGHDFGRVRIHTGPEADRSAEGLGAHAYTLGLDVRFRQGRYRPEEPAGRALLIHELEHVVRAGARGPEVPKLQPAGTVDHWENLAKILRLPGNRDVKLRQYVEAHPDSLGTAERILVNWQFKGRNEGNVKAALLNVLAKLDPKSKDRVANLVRGGTGLLRQEVLRSHRTMWRSYEAAAYAHAWLEWGDRQLKNKAKKLKPAEARLLQALRKAALVRFDVAVKDYESELRNANKTLDALMEASDAQPTLQLDVLSETSDIIQGGFGEARRERIHSYGDLNTKKKYPSSERDLFQADVALFKAEDDVKQAEARRTALEPPAGSKAAPTPDLKAARKASREAGTRKDQAKAARDLRSKERNEWLVAESRLSESLKRRDKKIESTLPADVQDPDAKLADLLDEEQKWWIYHKALTNLGTGFNYTSDSFSRAVFHEKTIGNIVSHRSRLASNRRALGVAYDVAVSTYEKHGEGQYDIYSHAGMNVNAAVPDQVDLTLVLGPSARSRRRLFQRVSSGVLDATPIDQKAADDSVLAKLIHGYFGFEHWDRKNIQAYLGGERQKLPSPSPDPTRILGGLTFEKTLAAQQPSADVIEELKAIRKALEVSLRGRLLALKPPVEVKGDIFDFVPADHGDFDASRAVSAAAYEAFYAIPGNFPVPGRPGVKSAYTRTAAAAAVYAAVRKAALEDATVSEPLQKLIGHLLDKELRGNRGGPSLLLNHKYREVKGEKEVWIQVYYGHMYEVEAMKRGAAVKADDLLGKVGSSGNSVSPHVHMGIAVYEQEPRGIAVPIGFIQPLDFFPFWEAKK